MNAKIKICIGYVVKGEPLNLPDGEYIIMPAITDDVTVLPGCCGTPNNCPIDYSDCPHMGMPPSADRPTAEKAGDQEKRVPTDAELLASEAKLYRDLTGDAMALGYDGIPAALEALRPTAVGTGAYAPQPALQLVAGWLTAAETKFDQSGD